VVRLALLEQPGLDQRRLLEPVEQREVRRARLRPRRCAVLPDEVGEGLPRPRRAVALLVAARERERLERLGPGVRAIVGIVGRFARQRASERDGARDSRQPLVRERGEWRLSAG
jgi:hypothetical protein